VVVETVVESIRPFVSLERAQVVDKQPAGVACQHLQGVVQRSLLPHAALVGDGQPCDGAEQRPVYGLLLDQLVGGEWAQHQNQAGVFAADQLQQGANPPDGLGAALGEAVEEELLVEHLRRQGAGVTDAGFRRLA